MTATEKKKIYICVCVLLLHTPRKKTHLLLYYLSVKCKSERKMANVKCQGPENNSGAKLMSECNAIKPSH
jgi:hypothetical protein